MIELTEAERKALRCHCIRLDGQWHHVRFCPVPAAEHIKADAHAAGVAETLGRVRDGLTRGMHLHHDGEHWVSLPYVLDLLDAALAGTSPQSEAPCACQSAEVRELVGPCDTSPQGEVNKNE